MSASFINMPPPFARAPQQFYNAKFLTKLESAEC